MMIFNDTSAAKNGLCQEVDTICKTNSTSYPLPDKARRFNSALDTYFQDAMRACGQWSLGDYNNTTDIAEASADLVSGQQDYGLNQTMLVLDSVWIKDSTGKLKRLEYVAENIKTTDTGVPTKYTKIENSIIFDVTPNYSMTAGITVFYRRTLPRFLYTDTTKTAGIPAIHEMYLCRLAALPYLSENGKSSKNDIANLIALDKSNVESFYEYRGKDERPKRLVAYAESNK